MPQERVGIDVRVGGNAARQFGQIRTAATGADASLGKLGAVVGGLGIGMAAAAVAGQALGGALEFDRELAKVASLSNEAAANISGFELSLQELSRSSGVANEELASGLYQTLSAGVPPDNAISFLATASQAAVAGATDTRTAVDGLSTAVNAFAADGLDATTAADIMFTTVKNGKLTFEELSRAIPTVAQAAVATGVSFAEVNAALAQMTSVGVPAREAATQIRSALQGMVREGSGAADVLEALGYESAEAAIKQLGFAKASQAVNDAAGGSLATMQKWIGNIEGVNAVMAVSGEAADAMADKTEQAFNAAGEAAGAYARVMETDAAKIDKAMNTLGTSAEQAAGAVLPALATIVTGLIDVADAAYVAAAAMADGLGGGAPEWMSRAGANAGKPTAAQSFIDSSLRRQRDLESGVDLDGRGWFRYQDYGFDTSDLSGDPTIDNRVFGPRNRDFGGIGYGDSFGTALNRPEMFDIGQGTGDAWHTARDTIEEMSHSSAEVAKYWADVEAQSASVASTSAVSATELAKQAAESQALATFGDAYLDASSAILDTQAEINTLRRAEQRLLDETQDKVDAILRTSEVYAAKLGMATQDHNTQRHQQMLIDQAKAKFGIDFDPSGELSAEQAERAKEAAAYVTEHMAQYRENVEFGVLMMETTIGLAETAAEVERAMIAEQADALASQIESLETQKTQQEAIRDLIVLGIDAMTAGQESALESLLARQTGMAQLLDIEAAIYAQASAPVHRTVNITERVTRVYSDVVQNARDQANNALPVTGTPSAGTYQRDPNAL